MRLAAKPFRSVSPGPKRAPEELNKNSNIEAVEGSAFEAHASEMPSMPGMFRSTTPKSNSWPSSAAAAESASAS